MDDIPPGRSCMVIPKSIDSRFVSELKFPKGASQHKLLYSFKVHGCLTHSFLRTSSYPCLTFPIEAGTCVTYAYKSQGKDRQAPAVSTSSGGAPSPPARTHHTPGADHHTPPPLARAVARTN